MPLSCSSFPLTVLKALTNVANSLNKIPCWSLSLLTPFSSSLPPSYRSDTLLSSVAILSLSFCCCFFTSYYSLDMMSFQSACLLYAALFSRHSFLSHFPNSDSVSFSLLPPFLSHSYFFSFFLFLSLCLSLVNLFSQLIKLILWSALNTVKMHLVNHSRGLKEIPLGQVSLWILLSIPSFNCTLTCAILTISSSLSFIVLPMLKLNIIVNAWLH